MTLRDLTGNPEIERAEIEDAAHFDGPLPGYDQWCAEHGRDGLTDEDLEFIERMEEKEAEERRQVEVVRLMGEFDKLIAALKSARIAEVA
jgi:hypothetical protein